MKRLLLIVLPLLLMVGCEDGQDTTPPTVTITSHSSGQSVYEIVTITVTTQDNEGISKVEFFIDDSLVLTDSESPYEYEWNTTQYEDDSEHIVKVISYDNSDNSTESQPILLRVDNTLSIPTPSVLYPITYDEGFQISWSQNNDDDFQSYKLYESLSENMSNDTLIYETDDKTDTTYFKTIQNFKYYKIVVEDSWGYQSTSNIEFGDYYVELWGDFYSGSNTTYLNLSQNQLTGSIPPEIGELINLTNLQLTFNQLTGLIPPEIGNLTNLERLQLRNNELTGEIPSEIGNLTNLEWLELQNNELTGSIPSEIGNLINLERLHLDNNQLTGSIPSELGNLINLDHLFLNDNQLIGEIPESICELSTMSWNSVYGSSFSINQLCPPYPSCLYYFTIGEQDTSDCD
jgi:Leucine-rich repeat (LRR) protein